MSQTLDPIQKTFSDRRNDVTGIPPVAERRQFANSYSALSPAAQELAGAIDEYKLHHRRRFITYEEMLNVIEGLGYQKHDSGTT